MLEKGYVLDGRFEILKQIGEGGTSTVYLAMNQKLNQQWVIKEIKTPKDSADTQRVLKEARMMMSFDNPAIPRIVDIIETDQETYIVMDYVSGQSLAHELKANGPQEQEIVIDWAKQICSVLAYLHSLEPPIIYHDLKPGNIILKEPERNLKLIDFGEARPCVNGNAPGGGKTKEYAAPEQQKECRGKTDQRTDIYCFGTTLYRLLTGKFPPRSPQPVGSIREAFPELQISKGMDNIIRKCTQVNPEKRFQSAQELMHALNNIQLWDGDYLKRLKRRIYIFITMLVLSGVLCLVGFGFSKLADYTNNQNYDILVETEKSVDYQTKVDNYLNAISINGADTRAYMRLLEAYEDNNQFGDAESQQITTLYNANKNSFDMASADVLELNYRIARAYFDMYSGEGGSFRARILKAQNYFQYVCDNGTSSYENYSISLSYYTLCNFYVTYVLSENSVQEPTKDDYNNMLLALEDCMQHMKDHYAGDAAYIRLVMYENILNMINVNLRGLAVNGIERAQAEEVIQSILDACQAESVTQKLSIEKQDSIEALVEDILDNVSREYSSLERG